MKMSEYDEMNYYIRFEAYCEKAMEYHAKKVLRSEYRWRSRFTGFSDLGKRELNYCKSHDNYDVFASWLILGNRRIKIENDMLYEVLMSLPERRLEIIILSYFYDWTDKRIGEKLNLKRSSIQYNRAKTLLLIKERLEDMMKRGGRNERKE